MIRLDRETRKLQLIANASGLPVKVSYSDKTPTDYVGGSQLSSSLAYQIPPAFFSSGVLIDICNSPAAGNVRDIDFIEVVNTLTIPVTVAIFYIDRSGIIPLIWSPLINSSSQIIQVTLSAGDSLNYVHGSGWDVIDVNGNQKIVSAAVTTTVVPPPYADAAGTPDAIVAIYTVSSPVLTDGYPLEIGITSLNTTTTPTFAPVLNNIQQVARVIVKFVNGVAVALNPGDLQGVVLVRYDLPNSRWILINPSLTATSVSAKLPTISAVANTPANGMTVSANPITLDFRSATLGSGAISTVLASPASLVIPSGATLGTVNAVQSRIVVVEMNNGGVAELAVANISGGLQMDETNLISTTAISAAATSATAWYSTTSRTSLPYRVVGYIESTQATAGTWVTAPSTIQSAGGNAVTSMGSLGYGQIWQNVTGSRTAGTTYYNTTGKTIAISLSIITAAAGVTTLTIGGVALGAQTNATAGVQYLNGSYPISPGESYSVTNVNNTISVWAEKR